MRGEEYNLICVQNTDFELVMTIKDDETNQAIDLSAYELEMEVQKGSDDPVLSTEIDTPNITATLTALGIVTVSVTDTVTNDLPTGIYSYNMTLIDGDGKKEPFLYGKFEVVSSVLKS